MGRRAKARGTVVLPQARTQPRAGGTGGEAPTQPPWSSTRHFIARQTTALPTAHGTPRAHSLCQRPGLPGTVATSTSSTHAGAGLRR